MPVSTCTLYFISSSPLSSQQIICILNLLNFPNFLHVMFSIFSVSFPCDLRRLLLFPIFFFLPVDCTIDNCQVFYFFNFFPLSSNQISCNLLVFPSYLSCFLFSQFLSSVISADYSCCIERQLLRELQMQLRPTLASELPFTRLFCVSYFVFV